MNTEIYHRSLPLLASALTDQRGIKVEVGGNKAFTDGRTIHLPSLPLDADESLLGAARGFADHECSHVLFTDFDAQKDANLTPLEKYLVNSIEDVRVERLMAERYPGCARNFRETAKHVFLDKAGEANPAPAFAVPAYVLLHLRSKACPALAFKEQEAAIGVALFFPGLVSELTDLLVEIETNPPADTKASIAYAKRIAALLESYEQQHAGQPGANAGNTEGSPDNDSSGNGGATADESPDADSNSTAESNSTTSESPVGSDDGHSDPTVSDQADSGASTQPSLTPLFADDVADKLPLGIGEALAEELTEGRSSDSYEAIRTAVEVTESKDFTPMPAHLLDKTLRLQATLRPMLNGVLQADTLEGHMFANRGKLAGRRLYKALLGDQHVFTQRIPARLTDTALHILVDRSGSTSGFVHDIAASAFAVSLAASAIRGVDVGLSAFPVSHPGNYDQPGVMTLMRHGRTNTRYLDFSASGGTPLAEAVWLVLSKLMRQRASRRILLCFTDGCPDSTAAAEMALRDAAKLGVEVYGVSYVNTAIVSLLGEERSIVIRDIAELPKTLTQMLLTALRRAA